MKETMARDIGFEGLGGSLFFDDDATVKGKE